MTAPPPNSAPPVPDKLPAVGAVETADPGLSFPTLAALRLRHAGRLGRDVARFGAQQRLWWFIPLIAALMLLAMAVTTTTTAVPVAVYTLF